MTEERISKKGNCYQCGKSFSKTAMKNHVLKEHNAGGEDSFLLKIESAEYKDFWLYIDIQKSKKIEYIDKFLRNIWLECCGHISRFADSYSSHGNIGKTRTVGSFNAGDEIYYEYDMGTPTGIYIKFMTEIKRPKQMNSVRLLARNTAPALNCSVCGEKAEYICTECMYDEDETVGSLFCKKCYVNHEHGDMILPLTNSPRSGECGYTGEQDLYGFTGDLNRDRETSIGKIRRYERVYTGDDTNDTNDIKDIKDIRDTKTSNIESNPNSFAESMAMLEELFAGNLNESDLTDDNLLKILGGFKNTLITPGIPVFTLKEIYAAKSIAALREIAEMEDIKNYSKLKKNELIEAITANHLGGDELKSVFLILTEQEFELFSNNLDRDFFITDESIFESVIPIAARVFVIFSSGGKYIGVIPKEIKELYKNLSDEGLLEKRRKSQNIVKYAKAAANLYGVINIKDFTGLFNEYNGLKIDCKDMEHTLEALGLGKAPYGVMDGYLINNSLYDSVEVSKNVKYIAGLQKNKARYIPSNEEFLKYEDADYYEETDELLAFKENLGKNGFKETEILEEMLTEMNWSIKNGLGKPLDFMRILSGVGYKHKSKNSAEKTIELALAMYGRTRMWINNGFSPNEAKYL